MSACASYCLPTTVDSHPRLVRSVQLCWRLWPQRAGSSGQGGAQVKVSSGAAPLGAHPTFSHRVLRATTEFCPAALLRRIARYRQGSVRTTKALAAWFVTYDRSPGTAGQLRITLRGRRPTRRNERRNRRKRRRKRRTNSKCSQTAATMSNCASCCETTAMVVRQTVLAV